MRKLLNIVSALVVFAAGNLQAAPDASTNAPLGFYVVSQIKMEGGKLIDTPQFPHLGYVAATPDLALTRLKAVALDPSQDRTVPAAAEHPVIIVTIYPEDADKLTMLTKNSIGQRILLMLGDTPLLAPHIRSPLTTMRFKLTCGKASDEPVIEAGLKKLVQ